MPDNRHRGRWQESPWFAWWYFAISAGFFLLAIYYCLRGGRPLLIALRCVIAVAFAALGYLQRQAGRADKRRRRP